MVDFGDRGLRTPEHRFEIAGTQRQLLPFMAAPLRPGETLVAARLDGISMLNQLVKAAWARPFQMEVALYLVPISTLGDYFVDLLVGDFEDSSWGS